MVEGLMGTPEQRSVETDVLASGIGRVTVLEALAEESEAISPDRSRRSTQMGNGVDAEDD